MLQIAIVHFVLNYTFFTYTREKTDRESDFLSASMTRRYCGRKGETMIFQRIQDLRVDSDLTQKQISEVLHISQRAYSHYETGSRSIPIEILIRLANYYDTTIDYLVGRSDEK